MLPMPAFYEMQYPVTSIYNLSPASLATADDIYSTMNGISCKDKDVYRAVNHFNK